MIKKDKKMIAFCGIFCEQCSFLTAYQENDDKHLKAIPYRFTPLPLKSYDCGGCKSENCICGICKIKPCVKEKNIDSCIDCASFPCELLNSFENDGMPHHKDAISNLKYIRKYGEDTWLESMQKDLYCPCGEKQTWYYKCKKHQ